MAGHIKHKIQGNVYLEEEYIEKRRLVHSSSRVALFISLLKYINAQI